ncbi:MAG: zinc-dependent alcohol dehydrogenase [Acidimicrobiales bacterium]
MKALVFERKELRYAAAMVAAKVSAGAGVGVGPLRLSDIEPPGLPSDDWVRVFPQVSGICGSDLATVDGKSSRYFDPLVSFPFVPGHEVYGELESGERVALEPVLGHACRGHELPFPGAAPGDGLDYGYLLDGKIDSGIQTGYCASTGGGWGAQLVAHPSQLHQVPEALSDEGAAILEPVAGGIHTAFKARIEPGDTVVVQGSGTMGLCALAAIRHYTEAGTIIAAAKYPHQRAFAEEFGADVVVAPSELKRAVRRTTGCSMIGNDLSGGSDVTIDAVGSASSISESLSVTRPRGRIVLLGMPGVTKIDLTPLWHRETEIVGSYTYGTEQLDDGTTAKSFDMAFDLVSQLDMGRLVSAVYRLDDYREAIRHAAEAGPRGAIKVAFDLRSERR